MRSTSLGWLVGIEGSHASGKTSLSLRLASALSSSGHRVRWVEDPARSDPFVEDVVIRREREFDAQLELSLFSRQVSDQLRAMRSVDIAVCDRTPMSCAAYTRLLLPSGDARDTLVRGFRAIGQIAAADYAAVFLLSDRFIGADDPLRHKVLGLEDNVHALLEEEIRYSGITPVAVPAGLEQDERLAVIIEHVTARIPPR